MDILLKSQHRNILEVATGENAIKVFKENKPDLVLLDIVLPDIGSKDVLKTMIKINPKAKVVMLDAERQETMIKKYEKSGAIGYLTEPFDEKKVLEMVKKFWNRLHL